MMTAFNRTVRQALAEMKPETLVAWQARNGADGMEFKARALIDRNEARLRAAGKETTIRTVWIALADAAIGGDSETGAAAMLAGMALGLLQG